MEKMAGRPKIPRAIKDAAGTTRPGREKTTPTPDAVLTIEPTEELSAPSLAYFQRITGKLAQLGILAEIDADRLTEMAINWEIWRAHVRYIQEHGPIITMPSPKDDGEPLVVKNPATPGATQLYRLMLSNYAAFGISPAEREKLSAPAASDDVDDLDPYQMAIKSAANQLKLIEGGKGKQQARPAAKKATRKKGK